MYRVLAELEYCRIEIRFNAEGENMKTNRLRIFMSVLLAAAVLFTSAPRSQAILVPIFFTLGPVSGPILITGVLVVAVGGTVYYVASTVVNGIYEYVDGPLPDPEGDTLLGTSNPPL